MAGFFEQVSQLYDLEAIKDLIEKVPTQSAGEMMVGLIVLHYLFLHDKKFVAWIVHRTLFKAEDFNADQIGEFFAIKDFSLVFTHQEIKRGVSQIVFESLKDLTQLNPIQFLKRYEEACKYFKVKEPVFASRSYYYYKSKCKENYRKSQSQK